ncbi:MAG: succinylglutamate desuccinylase/aspartoacylase family protein [Candidatus Bathyarchaeia archaeon]
MSRRLTIRDVEVEDGTKKKGFLKVGEMPEAEVGLPLMIIHGREVGPTLCITAGVHGNEYAGVQALMRLFTQTDPTIIRGSLIAVPVVNMEGFRQHTYVSPLDGLNIWRIFPGKAKGSMSEIIAYTLFNEVIRRSDYLIDLHSGADVELYPLTFYIESGDEKVDRASEKLAKCFHTKYVWSSRAEDNYLGAGLLYSSSRGIPAICSEAGSMGKVDEASVAFHLTGISNVMKTLNMIDGKPENIPVPTIIHRMHTVRTNRGGFWSPLLKVGSIVSEGELLGVVQNIFGEVLEEIRSPVGGVIWYYVAQPPVISAGYEDTVIIGEL